MRVNRGAALLLLALGAVGLLVSASSTYGDDEGLRLRPGDVLKIKVVNYDERAEDFVIGPDGTADLPVVGELQVAGLSGQAAQELVSREYANKLRSSPQVVVEAKYRVGILGEVFRPGLYYVNGTETFTDLLALAGGANSSARLSGARVSREGKVIRSNIQESLSGGQMVSDVGIRSGDVLYVPKKRLLLDWRTWTTFVSAALLFLNLYDRLDR